MGLGSLVCALLLCALTVRIDARRGPFTGTKVSPTPKADSPAPTALPACLFMHGTGKENWGPRSHIVDLRRKKVVDIVETGVQDSTSAVSANALKSCKAMWGTMYKRLDAICDVYCYLGDTRNFYLNDPVLVNNYCSAIDHVKPKVLVTHSAANLVVSIGIMQKNEKCDASFSKTPLPFAWFSSQAPFRGSQAPELLEVICKKGVEDVKKLLANPPAACTADSNIDDVNDCLCEPNSEVPACDCAASPELEQCCAAADGPSTKDGKPTEFPSVCAPKKPLKKFGSAGKLIANGFVAAGYCEWTCDDDLCKRPKPPEPATKAALKAYAKAFKAYEACCAKQDKASDGKTKIYVHKHRSIPPVFVSLKRPFVQENLSSIPEVAAKYVTGAVCGKDAPGSSFFSIFLGLGKWKKHLALKVNDQRMMESPSDGMVAVESCQLPGKDYATTVDKCPPFALFDADHLSGTFIGNDQDNNVKWLMCNIKKHLKIE